MSLAAVHCRQNQTPALTAVIVVFVFARPVVGLAIAIMIMRHLAATATGYDAGGVIMGSSMPLTQRQLTKSGSLPPGNGLQVRQLSTPMAQFIWQAATENCMP